LRQAPVSIDDSTLVRQWQQGDGTAMERLILRYQGRIFNVILKICANRDDAAELTQDTFVKVIENIGRFEQRSSFYTWIFRIAVNVSLNYCQRRAKVGFRPLQAPDDERTGGAKLGLAEVLQDDRAPEPARIAENNELCELVIKGIMKLDENQRAAMVLRDIEGMNYAEISRVLEVELGTVKSRIARARSNLRDILEASL